MSPSSLHPHLHQKIQAKDRARKKSNPWGLAVVTHKVVQ
jgi:hypothetical protein